MNRSNSPEPAPRVPASPRLSATVILLRQSAGGSEVFMVRRKAGQTFGDAYVFPGGVARADDTEEIPTDRDFTADAALRALSVRGGQPPTDRRQALAFWRTALRELFEEAGVLLATTDEGVPLLISPESTERFAEARRALQAGQIGLREFVVRERLSLSYSALVYFSHWITPASLPRRYDTRFFVARLPEGQAALPCQIETTDGRWIRPIDALTGAADGTFPLVFPTRVHLVRLSGDVPLEGLLSFAATKVIRTVEPARPPDDERHDSSFVAEVGECW